MAEAPFTGDGRRGLVEGLRMLFDEVSTSCIPAWISLEAPTGVGKTRVAQELYKRLALECQADPAYWPLALGPIDDEGVTSEPSLLERRRKAIFPDNFMRPAGSAPAWFWWGIACSQRAGTPVQALAADLDQLAIHADFVERVGLHQEPAHKKIGRFLARHARSTASAGGQDALSLLIGSALPFAGLVTFATARAAGGVRDRLEFERRQSSTEHVSRATRSTIFVGSLVEDTAARLVDASRHGFPIVLYIEDFHLADASLIELLSLLMSSKTGAVLLLTSSWPGQIGSDPAIARLLERVPSERVSRFQQDGASISHWTFPTEASLAPLTPDSLAEILQHSAQVEGDTAARLVHQYPNPLALQVLSHLSAVRSKVGASGLIRLDDAEIARMPVQLEDLYREAWRDLPQSIRQQLMFAAAAAPSRLSPGLGARDERWDARFVQLLVAESVKGTHQPTAVVEPLDAAAFGWAFRLDMHLRQFGEPVQGQLALHYADHELEAQREFANASASLLEYFCSSAEQESPVVREFNSRLHVCLVESGNLKPTTSSVAAVLELVASLQAIDGDTSDVLNLAQFGLKLINMAPAGTSNASEVELREIRARCLIRAGRSAEAEPDLRYLSEVFELDSPGHLRSRLLGVHALLDQERFDEAEAAIVEIVGGLVSTLGATHHDTVLARSAMAQCFTSLYRLDDASSVLDSLVNDLELSEDPASAMLLWARKELAAVNRRRGLLDEARDALESTCAGMVTSLGSSHPNTLAARQTLGAVLRDLGRLHEADQIFGEILGDRTRVLGPNHKASLTALSHMAWLRRHQGRFDEALIYGSELRNRLELSLGLDHPETLGCDHILAVILRQLGRFDDASLVIERVLRRRRERPGPFAYPTLLSWRESAKIDASRGAVEFGFKQLNDIAAYQRKLLGPRSIDVPSTEIDAADIGEMAGLKPTDAQQRMRAALNTLTSLTGPNHPEVARGRLVLAVLRI